MRLFFIQKHFLFLFRYSHLYYLLVNDYKILFIDNLDSPSSIILNLFLVIDSAEKRLRDYHLSSTIIFDIVIGFLFFPT